ncbi:hypothetical protein TNIN_233871 [Trichonephila inaurata madagascariensis]|uniref:Transmembrane protein n=1 Tax=Trichonephila inaurata madagascariensis TaxID=2747483 RepID=A0A8X6I5M3_9ARAC|nr:hypothetical protein TNIN_233871 [Trichonephila inaurata madagascariensis]
MHTSPKIPEMSKKPNVNEVSKAYLVPKEQEIELQAVWFISVSVGLSVARYAFPDVVVGWVDISVAIVSFSFGVGGLRVMCVGSSRSCYCVYFKIIEFILQINFKVGFFLGDGPSSFTSLPIRGGCKIILFILTLRSGIFNFFLPINVKFRWRVRGGGMSGTAWGVAIRLRGKLTYR